MKKIMLFLAVAGIMAACNNDNEVVNETQYITEFKAVFGGADTRMTATADNGLKFAWDDGDKLYVFNPDDEYDYYEFVYDLSNDKFDLEYSNYHTAGLEENKSYFATAQLLDVGSYTSVDGYFAVKTNFSEVGVSNIPLISDLFLAKTDGTIATMHHTVGMVEVPVKLSAESNISELELSGVSIIVEGANVTGKFYAILESPYYAGIIEGYEDSWVDQSETLNKSTSVSFFIPMLPGTYVDPELDFYYENGSVTEQLTGTLTIERGEVTKLPVQELTLN